MLVSGTTKAPNGSASRTFTSSRVAPADRRCGIYFVLDLIGHGSSPPAVVMRSGSWTEKARRLITGAHDSWHGYHHPAWARSVWKQSSRICREPLA
jgi:hypothetical protein